jgi:site-specific DNA-cytosine methylase
MNVLIINTYGGSLILGAKAVKANIIATMEDSGFGSDLQALNFPKIPRYERRADWPEKFDAAKWKDIDVVAHPPCSAFSSVNYSNKKTVTMGTTTGAFQCHQAVIDYALSHKARTLTIESVIGAYEGAHDIYEENATKHGYRINYVMVNSASCGVPQWRDRVWVVYHQLPKRQVFHVALKHEWSTIKDIISGGEEADFFGRASLSRAWEGIRKTIKPTWPTGNVVTVLGKVHDLERDAARAKFGFSVYMNANPVLLDPDGFSPVLMQDGRLCVYDAKMRGGRALSIEEHCAIMGFPRDYKWGKQIKKFRMYLSKGVCPPVAAWIMRMVDKNASGWTGPFTHEESDFGGVIDLRVKKQEALALANGRPWPPPGKAAVPRTAAARAGEHRTGAVIKARRDPDAPRGHRYVLIDEARCKAPNSPQAAFMLALLRKAGKTGMTRGEIVALAVKDPKGFPTNQPHDRAVGFFLSKFKGLGGLEFAE